MNVTLPDLSSVSQGQVAALVAAALAVFWMVGAYNRLVALRSTIGAAWQRVDELLRRRSTAITHLAAALAQPLAAEQGALDALLAADKQLRSAADALTARPVQAPLAAAVVLAEATLAAALARVLALLDQHPDWRHHDSVAPHASTLREAASGLPFARQLYNDAAAAYNSAVLQFPTLLLARIYSFGLAGRV